jgi:hypothetical protein
MQKMTCHCRSKGHQPHDRRAIGRFVRRRDVIGEKLITFVSRR